MTVSFCLDLYYSTGLLNREIGSSHRTMTITHPTTDTHPEIPLALAGDQMRDLLSQCIHCGLCLSACPTYNVFHTEMDSPRGRIALIAAAADGRIDVEGPFEEHIELCLGCRACETACPSGVQYGLLYEAARTAIEESRTPSRVERAVRWLGLRQLMPHTGRLRLLARTMRLYQATGVQRVVRGLNVLPKALKDMEAILPPLPDSYPDYSKPAPALGEKRGDVAFLYGCVQDAFLAGVNAASVRVLQRNGYEVHFPKAQTCCGAAQLHTGEHSLSQALARQNIDACRDRDYVAIISNAGGCGATLKQYDHLLADDPLYAPRAKQFVEKLKDISEFLADHLHNPPTGRIETRVTYVESCHLRHGQKVVRQPRQLLNAIPGVELIELKQPDMCCGSAGVYNITQPDTANQVLDFKLADVAQTKATTVVTTNTGCHMQMIYGVRKANIDAEVIHLVELLDRSYFKAEAQ
jgi:glycolate oxidase iron-sulfur subunit